MAGTKPLGRLEKTPPDEKRYIFKENILFRGNKFKEEENKIEYEICVDKPIGKGGESQVFHARIISKNNNQEVVAKIYDKYQDSTEYRDNRRKIIDFLNKFSDYSETHILPILDYGWVTIKSEYEGDPDYIMAVDIFPFCKSGVIKKADYKTLKEEIIPQVLRAIHLMHESNIVHRDIKPGNIYRYKDQIVISDFGTACLINDECDFRITETVQRRGTLGYTAPEVFHGYAIVSSDYFSFGCTLASLYKGEHVYQTLLDSNQEELLNVAIGQNGLPLNCHKDDKALQVLVDALIAIDAKNRAGYEDMLLWLENPAEFELKFKGMRQPNKSEFPLFKFQDTECHNMRELINCFISDWEIAKSYLYRGGIKNSIVINAFSRFNQSLAYRIGEILESDDTNTNYDLGLAKALHYMENGGPLYWKGKVYNSLSDISAAISSTNHLNGKPDDEICSMLSSKYISWKLENNENDNENKEEILGIVRAIESLAQKYPNLAYYLFNFQFAEDESNNNYNGYKTVDDIFISISNQIFDFYSNTDNILNDDKLFAYLSYLGYADNILKFKENLTGKPLKDMELLYRLFETISQNNQAIRRHYYEYGPNSHLFWLKQNLGLYSFKSKEAKSTIKKIEGIKFDPSHTIDKLFESFMEASSYQEKFLEMFQNNIWLAQNGITDGKQITSLNIEAYYIGEFCGLKVPYGYLEYLKKGSKNPKIRTV